MITGQNPEILMLVGFPASGKSTLSNNYSKTHRILSRDSLGGSLDDLAKYLEKRIKSGERKFVLDNTYPTKKSRKSAIDVAKKFNIPIKCLVLWPKIKITKSSIEDAIAEAQFNACTRMVRNYGRILSPEEIANSDNPNCFSPIVQFHYKNIFESPCKDEGFDLIKIVNFERITHYFNKALILDYDGTLRKTKNDDKYPLDPSNIEILPNRIERLQEYKDMGYILLGVSNQSGIEKGSITVNAAVECFDKTNELLGFDIDYRFCPHHSFPIQCFCRKPMPGMGVELIETYELDPSKCIMVGDRTTDKTFSKRCGFKFIDSTEFFEGGQNE